MPTSLESDNSLDRTAPHDLVALFEDRWQDGNRPDIGEYLDRTRPHDRSTLLTQLIRIDVQERLRHGEAPHAAEYVSRFPEDRGTILGINWMSLTSQVRPTRTADGAGTTALPRRSRIGRFDLIERLGVGGFGEVWRAFDTHLQRDVAIKIGHLGTDDTEQVHLLLHEARSAGRLRHPGLVPVHEAAVEDRIAYIVSDYIPGATLSARLKAKRLPFREAAGIAQKLADAVAHAHDLGIIHRDIKPANVLIDLAGDPHLTDFGVARRASADETISTEGQALGTPAYMAPEQARGEKSADHRVDVYSIGILLYELVAHRRAYPGDAREALQRVLLGPPQRPRLFRHDIPQDLETIIEVAIARNAHDRYQTAAALAEDLDRFLRGEPIVARRSSPLKRTWQWVRRRPVGVTVAALPILLAGGLWAANEGFDVDVPFSDGGRVDAPVQPVDVPPAPPEIAGEAHAKLLEAARAPDHRIECRLVELRTDPPGADVWLFPLDPQTGMVRAEMLIDPKANSPVRLTLPVGSYHVVADLGGGRFAEAVRRVPPNREERHGPLLTVESVAWSRIVGGVALSVKIPPPPRLENLVYVKEGDVTVDTGAGEPMRVHVPAFYVAAQELTLDQYEAIARRYEDPTRHLKTEDRFLPRIARVDDIAPEDAARLRFFEAEQIAHWNGMRLPDEFEWECAARIATATNWDAIAAEVPEEGFGPSGVPSSDRTETVPPIVGLRSNVAEWTSSWFDAASGGAQFPSPEDRDPKDAGPAERHGLGLRVIRGGDLPTVAGNPAVTPAARAIENRIGGHMDEPCPGVGCRPARSVKPRRAPEDFPRILAAGTQ
ncbi:MAG: protein kinase [Planctomycetaceae bacterium]